MQEKEFKYSYTAPTEEERKEAESIKREYEGVSATSKVQKLRELDKKVKRWPLAVSLTIGIVATLIFGLGLTLALEWSQYVWGVILGAIGALGMASAFWFWQILLDKNKKKYGKQIIELANEIIEKK